MSVFRANAATDNHGTWSVPNQRPAYADLYDGPTERLYESDTEPEPEEEKKPRRTGRGGVVFAVVLALLALIASAAAALISWRALAVASTRPAAAPAPTPTPATAPSAVTPSADPGLSGEATVDPSADPSATVSEYVVSYSAEPLKVQVGCAAVMYLDLDEPRADAGQQQSDLRYDSRCGTGRPTLTLAPGAETAAQVHDPAIDAPGCADAIRTSPLGVAAAVPVQKGTVLCVLTSAVEAEDRGDRPRMVLVEVTDVGKDGTAGLRATSWTVPE